MSQHIVTLFLILLTILILLLSCSGGLYLRHLWVAREQRRHALHVRLLRAELMQALTRDETAFLIDHWTRRDRRAAFEVASQLLGIIKGRDRQKLEAIVESNHILNKALLGSTASRSVGGLPKFESSQHLETDQSREHWNI